MISLQFLIDQEEVLDLKPVEFGQVVDITLPAAIRMISRPTAVEPVKAIFRTSG